MSSVFEVGAVGFPGTVFFNFSFMVESSCSCRFLPFNHLVITSQWGKSGCKFYRFITLGFRPSFLILFFKFDSRTVKRILFLKFVIVVSGLPSHNDQAIQ